MASVFCRPVYAVYPKRFGLATQKYMDTVYQPQITAATQDNNCHRLILSTAVSIMWSSTRSEWENIRLHPYRNQFVFVFVYLVGWALCAYTLTCTCHCYTSRGVSRSLLSTRCQLISARMHVTVYTYCVNQYICIYIYI